MVPVLLISSLGLGSNCGGRELNGNLSLLIEKVRVCLSSLVPVASVSFVLEKLFQVSDLDWIDSWASVSSSSRE